MLIRFLMSMLMSFWKYLCDNRGALDTATGLVSWDITKGVKVDYTELLVTALQEDYRLLGKLKVGDPVSNKEHKWVERTPISLTVLAAASLTAGGATLTVATNHWKRLRAGALLKDFSKGKTEVVQVLTTPTSVSVAITRGYGGTSGETHADAVTWYIISQPRQEGQDAGNGEIDDSGEGTNYTQIFQRDLKISGSIEAIAKAGGLAGIPDINKQALIEKTINVKNEMELAVVNGIKSASGGSDTVYRTMSGLIELIDVSGGNRYTTSTPISYKIFNTLGKAIRDDGGTPNLAILGTGLHQVISGWEYDKISKVRSDKQVGAYITSVITDLGDTVELCSTAGIPADVLLIVDRNSIELKPLLGRGWNWEPLAKTGDATKSQLIGEWTLEVHHAKYSHAIHRNLSTT